MYFDFKKEELEELEEEFSNKGYTCEEIEEIKHLDGALEIEDFIQNLQKER